MANRKSKKEKPENVEILTDANLVAEAPPAEVKVNTVVRFTGMARRTLYTFARSLIGIMQLLADMVGKMQDDNEIACDAVTADNSRTITVSDPALADMLISKAVELSLERPSSAQMVSEEIQHLRTSIKLFADKGLSKVLDLAHYQRVADDVTNSMAAALFGDKSELRMLQLEAAEASDELERDSVEFLEDSITELAVARGVSAHIVRGQIEKVWSEEESPKAKLLQVKYDLRQIPVPEAAKQQPLRGNSLSEKLTAARNPNVH